MQERIVLPPVFIGSPYSKPSQAANMARAADVVNELWKEGKVFPICPMIESHYMSGPSGLLPRSYEDCLARCAQFIDFCVAGLFLPGESSGKNVEKAIMDSLFIKHFEDDDIEKAKKMLYAHLEQVWIYDESISRWVTKWEYAGER